MPAENTDNQQQQNNSMLDVEALKKEAQPQNDQPLPAQKQEQQQQDNKPAQQPGQKENRPEWLGKGADKFWDAEKGAVKAEEIFKSFTELEKKFHRGDHKSPEKAEDYKIGTLKDDQKKMLFGDNAADPVKDEAFKKAADWAQKNKIPQGAFDEMLEMYADLVAPQVEKMQIDVAAEKGKLGKNADTVIKNQFDFLGSMYRSGRLNDAQLQEAQILMETAAGVQLLQNIREFYGEQSIPTNPTGTESGMPTRDELSSMLNDPKYESDPTFKKKVDGLYDQMYGTAPAISSQRRI